MFIVTATTKTLLSGVIHNADIFGVGFDKIDRIILSHGHFDHFAGLVNIVKRISSSRHVSTDNIDVFTHSEVQYL
jgi:metal-dependent hydrolase (beta-lactamase superfamily II)